VLASQPADCLAGAKTAVIFDFGSDYRKKAIYTAKDQSARSVKVSRLFPESRSKRNFGGKME